MTILEIGVWHDIILIVDTMLNDSVVHKDESLKF